MSSLTGPNFRSALCLMALAMSSSLLAAHPKLASDIPESRGSASVDVIVQFTGPVQQRHLDKVVAHGGRYKATLTGIRGGAFSIPATALEGLANDPEVAFISIDHKVQAHSLGNTPAAVNAPTAWSMGYTGAGVGVVVIDSGINSQIPDLGNSLGITTAGYGGRVVAHENFFQPSNSPNGQPNNAHFQTQDQYGHGTHVAGIIAGNGFLSTGPNYTTTYQGIAPQANLLDFQVLDQNGEGSDSLVIQAIDRAIAVKNQYNVGVINLSLGRPVYVSFAQDPLCQAVEQAWKAGIVVVVAAGNDGRDTSFGLNGYGTITSPGNDPFALTVGAMKDMYTSARVDDQITTYSSRGPSMIDHIVKPDLVAPGNLIASLYQQGGSLGHEYPQNIVSPFLYQENAAVNAQSSYYDLSGTSMSAAVVSGAVADLLSGSNGNHLTPDQVKARLMYTASKEFRTYTLAYYSLAAQVQPLIIQAGQAQVAIAQAQQAATQAANQVTSQQNNVTQDQQHVAQDQTKYNADLAPVAADNTAVATATANLTVPTAAYNAAVSAQAAADAALATAQAAQKLADQAAGQTPASLATR